MKTCLTCKQTFDSDTEYDMKCDSCELNNNMTTEQYRQTIYDWDRQTIKKKWNDAAKASRLAIMEKYNRTKNTKAV